MNASAKPMLDADVEANIARASATKDMASEPGSDPASDQWLARASGLPSSEPASVQTKELPLVLA